MTNFAAIIMKKELNIAICLMKSFMKSEFVHSWIIPLLHAMLWATGLYLTLKTEDIFSSANEDDIVIVKFLAIFIVLFLEILIVLLDVYVSQKANYLATRFILFAISLFVVIVGTTICAGLALTAPQQSFQPLLGVLVFSSILKFLENRLLNNLDSYIIKTPQIYDARGLYIGRTLV